MKTASAATIAILNNAHLVPVKRADLYEIVSKTGEVLRLTDADIALTVDGDVYSAACLIRRSQTKQSIGVNVNSIKIHIDDVGDTTVAGQPIIHQFKNGFFDYATVYVRKLFLTDWQDLSPGYVEWFEGEVSDVQCGQVSVDFTVKDALTKLNQMMPRSIAQPTCNNSLFKDLCGANEAAHTHTGTAASVVSRSKFTLSGVSEADTYFALGKAKITTGANAGISRSVKKYASGVIETFYPFPYDIEDGAGVEAKAGCDKLQATCSTKFSALDTFDAEPYIPVPETAIAGGSPPSGAVSTPGSTGSPAVGSKNAGMKAKGSYVA